VREILPDEHGRDGLARVPIPGETAFALIGEADGFNRAGRLEAAPDIGDELGAIVFDEAGVRIELPVFDLICDAQTAVGLANENARGARALVDGGDGHFRPPRAKR